MPEANPPSNAGSGALDGCWCLQCVFRRLDAEAASAPRPGRGDRRGGALDAEEEAWLKREAPDGR